MNIMKIVHAGIFKDHALGGDVIFRKGFLQNNCAVTSFDYRTLAAEFGVQKMFDMLRDVTTSDTDILFIGKGEIFEREVLRDIKNKGVQIALWYGDIRPEPENWLLDILPEIDCFFMSSGGFKLREYFERGRPKVAAFYFNPFDPDLIEKYQALPRRNRDIVFTASAYDFIGSERKLAIKYLKSRDDVTFFGGGEASCGDSFVARMRNKLFGVRTASNWIRGEDYIAAIKSAKIGIGVSAYQNIPRYTSDRMTHFLGFGSFLLAWEFPQIELFFDIGQELVVFKNIGDLKRKIDYFLRNESEREAIALAGQSRILSEYNCKNMAALMIDVIATGQSTRFPWVEIFK
jgi:hypothetical protein